MSNPDVTDPEAIPTAPDVDPPDPQPGGDDGQLTGDGRAKVNREDDAPA
jgi:hypothetical protein